MKKLRVLTLVIFLVISWNGISQFNNKNIINSWKLDYHRTKASINEIYGKDDSSQEKLNALETIKTLESYQMEFKSDQTFSFVLNYYGTKHEGEGSWVIEGNQLTLNAPQGQDVNTILELSSNKLGMKDAQGMVYYYATEGNLTASKDDITYYVGQVQNTINGDYFKMGLKKENGKLVVESYVNNDAYEYCTCEEDKSFTKYKRGICLGLDLTKNEYDYGFFTSDDEGNFYFYYYPRVQGSKIQNTILVAPTKDKLIQKANDSDAKAKMMQRAEQDSKVLFK